MSGRSVRLGEIAYLARRKVEPVSGRTYREIGILSYGRGVFIKPPVEGSALGEKRVFTVAQGDLLVSNIFAWEGAIALASPDVDGLIGSHRFMTWVVDPDQVDASYLKNYLLSGRGLKLVAAASPGSAGRNRTLGVRAFESLEIYIPDLEKQRRIAAFIASVDSISSTAEGSASYQEERLRGLRERLLLDCSLQSTPCLVGDFLRPVRRMVPVESGELYRQMGVRSFGRGAFDAGTMSGADTSYSRLHFVKKGDVVYPKLMAWEGAFDVVPSELDGRYVSPEFCTFEVDEGWVDSRFLGHVLRSSRFANDIVGLATGTNARRRRLLPENLLRLSFQLPSRRSQSVVADKLDSLAEAERLIRRRREIARSLVQSARNYVFA